MWRVKYDEVEQAKRRSQQMCCSCVLTLLLLQALVLAIILAIVAPHALWRVQLSRQAALSSGCRDSEPRQLPSPG